MLQKTEQRCYRPTEPLLHPDLLRFLPARLHCHPHCHSHLDLEGLLALDPGADSPDSVLLGHSCQ
jgi:hypothetical protein